MGFDSVASSRSANATVADLASAEATRIRVGFDMTGVYVTQAGIARYVRGLKRGLEQTRPGGIEIFPIAWEVQSFSYQQPQRAMKTIYRELIWGKLIAPRILSSKNADLLHSTSSLFIRRPGDVRHVVTLHDLSISRHPERFRKWQIQSWHRRLPVIRNADRVIAISRFTADEAMRMLGLEASKIDVVHNGCDWHEDQITFCEARPTTFAVPDEFFLFVGSLEPGKNLKLLKQAWLYAEQQNRRLPPLLIVGSRWEGVATEGEQPKDWHYLGRQPDDVLLYLYRRAQALMFPSIYEGFGFPVIEAMAQGCPVICSPTSSLPEVAGDAAMMVPLAASEYVKAARELLSRPDLRQDLIARGRQRAARFTWRRCAEETAAVYHKVMQR